MKKKQLALSVLSTALVASMAASAFAAAPKAGVYIGGNVDKYYSFEAMGLNMDAFLDEMINTVPDVLYVSKDGEAKGGNLAELLFVSNPKSHFVDVTDEMFADIDGADGFNGVNEDGTVETVKRNPDGTPFEGTPGDLKVESVSAITLTSVEVTLAAPVANVTADKFKVAIGEEAVAVAGVQLKAGTEKTYVLSVSLDGKSGSLKVNDVESAQFDFSANGLANAIAAVKAANSSNIIAALEAPVLGLTAIDSTLAAEYVTEIGKSFVSSRELIQAAVDRVNAAAGTDLGEKIAAVKAANGPVALLDALEKLGVQRIIGLDDTDPSTPAAEGTPSLAAKYYTAIASQTIATKADVQAIVDTVNGEEVTKLVVAAEAAVTTDSVTAAATLLAAYDNGIADDTVEADLDKRLDVVTALVAVNAAPDAAGLLAAIKSADLALVEVVDANVDAYKAQVDAQAEGFKFATVAQLQNFVKQVNATVNTSAIDAVNKAADSVALLAALKSSVLGLKKVEDGNEAAYFAALTGKTFTTVTEIQAFVDEVNGAQSEAALVAAINTATKSNIEEAVTNFVATFANDAYINVGSKKRAEVISTFWVNHGEGRSEAFTSAAEVSAALTAAVSEYEGYINGINSAKNITEMRAAFDIFIDDLEAAYGDEVTTKVEELQNTSVYANGSFTIEAATSIFEALQTKRSDADTTNDDFATVAEALSVLAP